MDDSESSLVILPQPRRRIGHVKKACEPWMFKFLDEQQPTTSRASLASSTSENKGMDLHVTDNSLWRTRIHETTMFGKQNKTVNVTTTELERTPQNDSSRQTTSESLSASQDSEKKEDSMDLHVSDNSLWRTRIQETTLFASQNKTLNKTGNTVFTKRTSSVSKKSSNITYNLNVTDNSLWRTRISEVSEKETTAKSVNIAKEIDLEESLESPIISGNSFDLHVSDNSLWRTKVEESKGTEVFEPCFDLGQGFQSLEDEDLEKTFKEVGEKSVFGNSVWTPPIAEEENSEENTIYAEENVQSPPKKNLQKSPNKIHQKSTKEIYQKSPKENPQKSPKKNLQNSPKKIHQKSTKNLFQPRLSIAPLPRFSMGLPYFRNLNVPKRKYSCESSSSIGSDSPTNSPARKIRNCSKSPKSSPRLVDRVRQREMLKAYKKSLGGETFNSPTLASLNKSRTKSPIPLTEVVCFDQSGDLNQTIHDKPVTPKVKTGVKRFRQMSPKHSSALGKIALDYKTPPATPSTTRGFPLNSILDSVVSKESTQFMSGPIPSQPPPLNLKVQPRILFENDESCIPISQELTTQPGPSTSSNTVIKRPPFTLLNDSDFATVSATPTRSASNFFFEDTNYENDLVEAFESTKILSFANENDDLGTSLMSKDGDLSSPAPKHIIIAGKKNKETRIVEIRPPKIVKGTEEFPDDRGLRRSTRTRPARRLNAAAGEQMIYSPGGSLLGVTVGHEYNPLCIKYNTLDKNKALEMDKQAKKNGAKRRKENRLAREERLAQLND